MKKVFFFRTVLVLSVCIYARGNTSFAATIHTNKARPLFSNPTDYFRSVAPGLWSAVSTWESSPDNINWLPATLTPTAAAATISIKNTHTVTVNNNQDMDEVIIESGGILLHSLATLTINDGAGDDVIVQNGGVFTLASDANPPVFSVSTATVNINTAGILRVSATGLTFASPAAGVNTSNYIYQNASILEYTPNLAFATTGVTYFPNVDAVTIPVFRTTNNLGLLGGASNTVINGLFEANGTATFQFGGTKTFRNGITGTGNVTCLASSGKFIINGATANLGGAGTLTLPTLGGMDIGTSTTATMVSAKAVTGTINLLADALVMLGSYNLTVTGTVGGGSATSHIVTNGSGKLVMNNVGVSATQFPVGSNSATYNPMTIANGDGFNYGVRVETGLNPTIGIPLQAVNRTWFVTPLGGTPPTVNTSFFYFAGEGNAGFNYSSNLELGQYTGVWNVIQTALIPSGSYQVATTVSTFGNNIEAPLVLGNIGAILASQNRVSVNYFTGIKQNSDHLLNWKITCNSTPAVTMVLERSTDAINYTPVYTEYATALSCLQPFDYTDDQPAGGVNYYRIKMTDVDGKVSYSSIVALINAVKGMVLMNIAPNPVFNGSFNIKISAAEKMPMELVITDMQGRILQKRSMNLLAGFNSIPVPVGNLARGVYQVYGNTVQGRTRLLRFVVQ